MKNALSLFILCALLSSLVQPTLVAAASSPLVISEVGAFEKSGTDALEWVEIYNRSTSPIDLTKWKFLETDGSKQALHGITAAGGTLKTIAPKSYAIIAQNDLKFKAKYPGVLAPVFDSSWSTLNEGGEFIGLKNEADELTEGFTYLPGTDKSIERIAVELDDYTAANWSTSTDSTGSTVGLPFPEPVIPDEPEEVVIPDEPTPVPVIPPVVVEPVVVVTTSTPVIVPTPVEPTVPSTTPVTTMTIPTVVTTPLPIEPVQVVAPHGLYINELMPVPDSEDEWIELYNNTDVTQNLSSCTLNDISATDQLTGTIAPHEFKVLAVDKVSLNNSGDHIALTCDTAVLDEVIYGTVEGTLKQNNAPTPKKGLSLSRTGFEGNAFNILFVSTTPSKGATTIMPEVAPVTPVSEDTVTTPSVTPPSTPTVTVPTVANFDIVLNELLPKSISNDGKDEFIELYNRGNYTVDLRGWVIGNSSNSFTLKSTEELRFPPGAFYTIGRTSSTIAMKDSDTITLKDPSKTVVDTFSYRESEPGVTWARFGTTWNMSSKATRDGLNEFIKVNHPPVAFFSAPTLVQPGVTLTLSGVDSTDKDNDALTLTWNFGDTNTNTSASGATVQHTFMKEGVFPVVLSVFDGGITTQYQRLVTVKAPPKPLTVATTTTKAKRTAATVVKYQYNDVEFATLQTLPTNTNVIVEGTVHYVVPGSSVKTFYLGNPGIAVASGSVQVTRLLRGDRVRLKAVLSVSADGARTLKLKELTPLGHTDTLTPLPIEPVSFASSLGSWVTMEGVVSARKTGEFTLTLNHADCAVIVPKTLALPLKNGDGVRVNGTLVPYKSGCKLVVSDSADISVLTTQSSTPRTLTMSSPYMGATAGGFTSVTLAALWRRKGAVATWVGKLFA